MQQLEVATSIIWHPQNINIYYLDYSLNNLMQSNSDCISKQFFEHECLRINMTDTSYALQECIATMIAKSLYN